jgi:DNA polymerase-3 subunit epsilon
VKLLTTLFGRRSLPAEPLRRRIANWQQLPAQPAETPFATARYVVIDTETSGLNPARDRLLSIGGVTLEAQRVMLAEGFDSVLRQTSTSEHPNILVHGIGEAAQRGGEEPREALVRFLEYAGKAPLFAYHAPFDEAMLKRAMHGLLGLKLHLPWLDLAVVLPALFEEKPHQALDFWLARFEIDVPARHSALGDALATAQLAQIALHKAQSRGLLHFKALSHLARNTRWLTQ